MPAASYGALVFTVALLAISAYFLIGGLPLLILKHDVPLDARFVRRFFEVYYLAAFWAAAGASVSYALWGREAFAAGMAVIAGSILILHRLVLRAMQDLGARIEASSDLAIRGFRRVHATALLANFAQLIGVVWGLIALSQALR